MVDILFKKQGSMSSSHAVKNGLILLFLVAVCLQFVSVGLSNPIPVYPDPQPDYHPPAVVISSNPFFMYWLLFAFLLDFACDILIMYAGLYILDKTQESQNRLYFEDFSRLYFAGAVFLISLVGIVTELILGMWIGGLLIILGIVFLSFYGVSKKLFRLSMNHSIFMGMFAVLINSIIWMIIFSL